MIFLLDIETVPTVWYFFHFIPSSIGNTDVSSIWAQLKLAAEP